MLTTEKQHHSRCARKAPGRVRLRYAARPNYMRRRKNAGLTTARDVRREDASKIL